MNNLLNTLSLTLLAATIGFTSMSTAQAMPITSSPLPSVSNVENVQILLKGDNRRGFVPGNDETGRSYYGGRRGWDRNDDRWYHGHRGYRDRRDGYRRHSDGFWYPLAAFGAGAIIGGTIASQPRANRVSSHVEWCASRYRTYRASDNTYVPRAGVRAQCVSPY